ncbi:hypothetical protein RJ639_001759 [Escallonia herrerae]|uniref:Uncharacterized protein n=1 Tax=Escallonia herrerae TaxID=1293975 RepID=A0AA88X8U0_9ASTE|nr:hypothetical protein RJ639_001759 [Escallonia herrerae]
MKAPGPDLTMISRRSSSMADFRTMGRTEALASCMANKKFDSSSASIGLTWVSLAEPINFSSAFSLLLDLALGTMKSEFESRDDNIIWGVGGLKIRHYFQMKGGGVVSRLQLNGHQ